MIEQRLRAELHQLEGYLRDALGVTVKAKPWSEANRLPPFLRERYRFAQAELLNIHALFVIDTKPEEESPATVRKHLDTVQAKQHVDVIYVRPQVTAYNRKRLIEQKVPFIVPGNQMYLPMAGIDFREHFRRVREESSVFSPSTQVLVLHALLRSAGQSLVPSEMAPPLGYSVMTMTRAFDEMEATSLAEVTMRGRERCLRFAGSRKEIWEKAQPYLRTPVTKRLFIHRTDGAKNAVRAGLTALAQYSMLAAPGSTTYALSRENWKALRQSQKIIQVPTQDPDADQIEVWSYSPELFSEHGFVDQLSLYLSLKDDRDERTEAALEEMMEKFQW